MTTSIEKIKELCEANSIEYEEIDNKILMMMIIYFLI